MRLRMMLLIGVLPPVDALTLLLPYPPNAGRAMKHPPTILATPSATSSRLALSTMPCRPSRLPSPPPRLLAATEDSKKPRRAIRKEVLMASLTCFMCEGIKGHLKGKGEPVLDFTWPRISSPFLFQPHFQVKTAERTTTINRSGMYATDGYRGCKRRLSSLPHAL